MTGMFFSPSEEGGFMYSDELSDALRTYLQPTCKFRQFSEPREADKPLHKGERFSWNIYGDSSNSASELGEREPIPETDFVITQSSLTVKEAGIAVPYSGKLEALAKHDIVAVIKNVLGNNARKYFDAEVYTQFDACALRVTPTSGTSLTALTLDTDGTASVTNNVELGKEHINLVGDLMRERNIPAYADTDYFCIARPTTLRPIKNDLEAIHVYTDAGMAKVYAGEKGRYDGFRFVEETFIPVGGAEDSVTFNPYTNTGDAWNNAKSSWAFFFGADTVLECLIIPEEIRAKIPEDFGRSKALAWYYLGGYGLTHTDATNGRIIKWDSAA